MPKKKVKLGEPKSRYTPDIYTQEKGLSKRKHVIRVMNRMPEEPEAETASPEEAAEMIAKAQEEGGEQDADEQKGV